MTSSADPGIVTREAALKIAADAAGEVYGDTSVYTVLAQLREDAWYVDYRVTDPDSVGGGPHFVIDAATGEVLTRRFEQ